MARATLKGTMLGLGTRLFCCLDLRVVCLGSRSQ